MIVRRFYEPQLAQYSYLIGCPTTRSAIVIDPVRDADQYIEAAAAANLRITHVTETHIHADFVSGSARARGAHGGDNAALRRGRARMALRLRRERWRAAAPQRRHDRRGTHSHYGAAYPRPHARASLLRREGPRHGRGACGHCDGRLRIRGQCRAPRPARARGERGRHDGRECAPALHLLGAYPEAPGLSPDLARPRRGQRVRQVARRHAFRLPWATSASRTGHFRARRETRSSSACSRASRSRRPTSA